MEAKESTTNIFLTAGATCFYDFTIMAFPFKRHRKIRAHEKETAKRNTNFKSEMVTARDQTQSLKHKICNN